MHRHRALCVIAVIASLPGVLHAEDLSPCDVQPPPGEHLPEPPVSYAKSPNRLQFWVSMHAFMTGSYWSVGVATHGNEPELVLVTGREDVATSDRQFDAMMRWFPTARSPATTWRASRISQDLYMRLYAEWERSLRKTRAEPDLAYDGAYYEFHFEDGRCAYTYSPDPPSRAFDLTLLAGAMRTLAMKHDRSVSLPDETPVLQELASLPPPGHAYYLKNIRSFARNSDLTALVLIHAWHAVHAQYTRGFENEGFGVFDVDADVVESFHGTASGSLTFRVILPAPDTPPRNGQYIVTLEKDYNNEFVIRDDSIPWTRPTPALLHTLRSMR